jgi:hypothetical protein
MKFLLSTASACVVVATKGQKQAHRAPNKCDLFMMAPPQIIQPYVAFSGNIAQYEGIAVDLYQRTGISGFSNIEMKTATRRPPSILLKETRDIFGVDAP